MSVVFFHHTLLRRAASHFGYCASVIYRCANDATHPRYMVTLVDVVVPSGRDTTRIQEHLPKGNYSGWNRRDTLGTSSSGNEDKHANWKDIGDYDNEERRQE